MSQRVNFFALRVYAVTQNLRGSTLLCMFAIAVFLYRLLSDQSFIFLHIKNLLDKNPFSVYARSSIIMTNAVLR